MEQDQAGKGREPVQAVVKVKAPVLAKLEAGAGWVVLLLRVRAVIVFAPVAGTR